MKHKEKRAYKKLIDELKYEFPLFRKYSSDYFYYNKDKYDDDDYEEDDDYNCKMKRGSSIPHFVNNENIENEINEYINCFVEEMNQIFIGLEKSNSISKMCNIFLKNYEYITNDYYDFIDCNYINSKKIENMLRKYLKNENIENEKSHYEDSNKINIKKKIDEKNVRFSDEEHWIKDEKHKKTDPSKRKYSNKKDDAYVENKKNTNKENVAKNNYEGTMKGYETDHVKHFKEKEKKNLNGYNEKKTPALSKKSDELFFEEKNFFQEENVKNINYGFSDISYILFTDNYFHVNFGLCDINDKTQHLKNTYIINNITKSNDNIKNTRLVVFGMEGKKLFLNNIKPNSKVKGWIEKYDSELECFYVRIYSIKSDLTNNTIERNIQCYKTNNNSTIYACLPVHFINKFEFTYDLDLEGLPIGASKYFMYMCICAEIFDDETFINNNFKNILYYNKCDFFITFKSKYNDDHNLGFCLENLNENFYKEKKIYEKWDRYKKIKNPNENKNDINILNNHINYENNEKKMLHVFNWLLYSDRKFYNYDNIVHKRNFLLLNIYQTCSLIKFHLRNVKLHLRIGNTITKKQNLVWSNDKFMEAFQIYKKNSKYYNFLKHYFYFESYLKSNAFIYSDENDQFLYDNNLTNDRENDKKLINTLEGIRYNAKKYKKDKHEIEESDKKEDVQKNSLNNLDNFPSYDNDDPSDNYYQFYYSLDKKEKYIVKNIVFLNDTIYKEKWIYDFLSCIKLTINLNDQNILANFLLSLFLLELSCYTESFLLLYRIFKIKKLFIDSYKLKNIIFILFIKQIKKYINKDTVWKVILNFKKYDIFNMREQNSSEYCHSVFQRNIDIVNTLEEKT